MQPSKHLVVIGGGIAGLSAAWSAMELAQQGGLSFTEDSADGHAHSLRVTLLDAGSSVGGKAVSTQHAGGWLTESGPTGYLNNEPVMHRLALRAGLTPVSAQAEAARRYLLQGGELREIDPHPLRFARSGILSMKGVARLVRERWVARRTDGQEESVYAFAQRRLGTQAAERMIAPMVMGVFAGDARELSLAAAFPAMAAMEEEYGSLFKALKAKRKAGGKQAGGPAGPGGTLTTFAGGLQVLPKALIARAPFEVRHSSQVTQLEALEGRRWGLRVQGDSQGLEADGVIVATEGWAAGKLLADTIPAAQDALAQIPFPGVQVVSLGWGARDLPKLPVGFGCLAPRSEGLQSLGVLWDSQIFDDRAPEGHTLLRFLFGGAVHPEASDWDEARLVQAAQEDAQRLFGAESAPKFQTVKRWDRAIPQYTLGHAQRVETIERALGEGSEKIAPIALAGNALHGVAFSKAAQNGWSVGAQMTERLCR